MHEPEHTVVIVGAGPTGLALGAELKREIGKTDTAAQDLDLYVVFRGIPTHDWVVR
jgi:2-polyprenyl-6-methoxyphenol hydroxylase-like FAD-dependent oxidoreductase